MGKDASHGAMHVLHNLYIPLCYIFLKERLPDSPFAETTAHVGRDPIVRAAVRVECYRLGRSSPSLDRILS